MMAHELLRQAAQILGAGWSKGASARDATGRIVPLFAGAARAALILAAGWSKGASARDDAGSIVPLHIGRQPGRHQSGRGGVLALWRDVQGRQSELAQARITAACNALHHVEARFCRWLLQSADRAGSDTVTLTQELLAEMLAVRRTSVTEVAVKIQNQGLITYSRGVIKILDRPSLERMSCECYQTLVAQEAMLI
jgi:hypothetical protein